MPTSICIKDFSIEIVLSDVFMDITRAVLLGLKGTR